MSMATKTSSLYIQVIKASEQYLGPASERFMRRQIENHLKILPEEITQKDIPKLVEWTRLAFSMLTKDADQINHFMDELLALSENAIGRGNYAKRN